MAQPPAFGTAAKRRQRGEWRGVRKLSRDQKEAIIKVEIAFA